MKIQSCLFDFLMNGCSIGVSTSDRGLVKSGCLTLFLENNLHFLYDYQRLFQEMT